MPLALRANSQFIHQRIKQTVSASGGTEPYVYSVVPGGVGGTINSGTGLYQAPEAYGVDTLRVTDDLGATADLAMNVLSPIHLVAQIIEQEMSLADDRIWIYNQKINEPKDEAIYVVIQVASSKPFGNNTEFDASADMSEVQSINVKEMITIDVKSRSTEALYRYHEAIMAMKSVYSQQQQELNNFRIGTIPTQVNNIGELDGSAIPYRFNIAVNLLYVIQKTKAVPYFDDFSDVEVTTDLTEE